MTSLMHYGKKRRSGRYPWGSGDSPEQRNKSFLGYVEKLKEQGIDEVTIAEGMGLSTTELRARKSIAKSELRRAASAQALILKNKGMSNVAIGKRMGINESSVRSLLDPVLQERSDIAVSTANMLKDVISKKGPIDVGAGVETHIGISKTKLNTAIALLEEEGYNIHYLQVRQLGTGKDTSLKVLAPPLKKGETEKEQFVNIAKNKSDIKTISDFAYSPDDGITYRGQVKPKSISSDKVAIRYKEDGGSDKDGVIELRRGVSDLSLGNKKYAQVRIGVDDTHYLKGMAIYSDKMPPGIDIIYNSNKPKGTAKTKVFKEMETDKDGNIDFSNPFGTLLKPGGQRGMLNIVNEEGDWTRWSKNISSQVLSKQSAALAAKQLKLARDQKLEEFDEISGLTNPVVKKALLQSFADDADAAAVHLKAAALPRQANKILLPIPSLKENEIYAPTFNDGELVTLIRHPHGGIFEIPELKVNNKSKDARSIMENAIDAVGINPKVAEKLSGADFDGDTVIVIPNHHRLIKTAPTLKALKDFNTKEAYPPYDGMTTIDGGVYNAKEGKVIYSKKPNTAPKQMKMGDVSNLITDMTIKGASGDEIARAVKHSMVVIDSEKHHLDYKKSAIDNGIPELKKKYQGGERSGAATLISRSKAEYRVPERVEGALIGPVSKKTGKPTRLYIDPNSGEKLYQKTGATFVNAKGKVLPRTTKSTKMFEEKDAFKLSSGSKIESVYAEHANALKALANRARKLMIETPNLEYSPTAKQTYVKEVASLKAKLNIAFRNKPNERQAQLLANKIVAMKKEANPNLSPSDLKKIKGLALEEARARTGAHKQKIVITDAEWNAIQLGAVSNNYLTQIIMNTDLDALRVRATPRTNYKMTDAKINKAKLLLASGNTIAEVANAIGVSSSSIQDLVN